MRAYVRQFGEGRFVCDGVMARRGDDKAGGPHCCALLKQERVPPPPRYEDWDAPDARFDDRVLPHPPSYKYVYGARASFSSTVTGIEEVSRLVNGFTISPSIPAATVLVQGWIGGSMRKRLPRRIQFIEEDLCERKQIRRWRKRERRQAKLELAYEPDEEIIVLELERLKREKQASAKRWECAMGKKGV